MNRIQSQADKLWQLLISPDTAAAYGRVVAITLNIVKEAALLVWLTICLVLVVFEWGWHSSIAAGRGLRGWWDNTVNNMQGSNDQIASEAGKALLTAGKNSLDFTLTQAKSQLGISAEMAEDK